MKMKNRAGMLLMAVLPLAEELERQPGRCYILECRAERGGRTGAAGGGKDGDVHPVRSGGEPLYFAIRSFDDLHNRSGMSNVARADGQ